jgi:putative beta-lysine N-acetyltransferase
MMFSALNQEIDSYTLLDRRNKRLVVNGYMPGTEPQKLAESLRTAAQENNLGKIWLWAKPADVPDFLNRGFQLEGHLFRGRSTEFAVSLAYFQQRERGQSEKISMEDEILKHVSSIPRVSRISSPLEVTLGILNQMYAEQVSQLLTRVFSSYPTPVENPHYIRSLMQNGCIFAGAHYQGKLISIAAAYPEPASGRCELTDCATLEQYRGYSLTEKLLEILEKEVDRLGSYVFYTLARAQSAAMNRVFYKSGYRFRGRLINNCHISGSFQDMNLWLNMK